MTPIIFYNLLIARITNMQIVVALQQFKGSLGTDWAKIMCATCMSFVPGIVMTGLKN